MSKKLYFRPAFVVFKGRVFVWLIKDRVEYDRNPVFVFPKISDPICFWNFEYIRTNLNRSNRVTDYPNNGYLTQILSKFSFNS